MTRRRKAVEPVQWMTSDAQVLANKIRRQLNSALFSLAELQDELETERKSYEDAVCGWQETVNAMSRRETRLLDTIARLNLREPTEERRQGVAEVVAIARQLSANMPEPKAAAIREFADYIESRSKIGTSDD